MRPILDLIRIAVDQTDRSIICDKDVAFVDVTNYNANVVQRVEGRGAIPRDVNEEVPPCCGEFNLPLLRTKKLMNLLPSHQRHEEPTRPLSRFPND
ncbi:MAG TPA: hypothetical protein VM940_00365 [Chthoniobacterales bacterium]|nr:hypothetical protein [Chthoniobacterales bacterium]